MMFAPPPPVPVTAAVPVRTCEQRAESIDANPAESPRPTDLFIARRLLIVGGREGPVRPVRLDSKTYWWKALADIRAGRAVTISIPRAERRYVALRYAEDSNGQFATGFAAADPVVRLEPCADRPWTYYPGGFVYRKKGCYAVDFRFDGGRTIRRRIPLGARC